MLPTEIVAPHVTCDSNHADQIRHRTRFDRNNSQSIGFVQIIRDNCRPSTIISSHLVLLRYSCHSIHAYLRADKSCLSLSLSLLDESKWKWIFLMEIKGTPISQHFYSHQFGTTEQSELDESLSSCWQGRVVRDISLWGNCFLLCVHVCTDEPRQDPSLGSDGSTSNPSVCIDCLLKVTRDMDLHKPDRLLLGKTVLDLIANTSNINYTFTATQYQWLNSRNARKGGLVCWLEFWDWLKVHLQLVRSTRIDAW